MHADQNLIFLPLRAFAGEKKVSRKGAKLAKKTK
jgi:hypothetical protein